MKLPRGEDRNEWLAANGEEEDKEVHSNDDSPLFGLYISYIYYFSKYSPETIMDYRVVQIFSHRLCDIAAT